MNLVNAVVHVVILHVIAKNVVAVIVIAKLVYCMKHFEIQIFHPG